MKIYQPFGQQRRWNIIATFISQLHQKCCNKKFSNQKIKFCLHIYQSYLDSMEPSILIVLQKLFLTHTDKIIIPVPFNASRGSPIPIIAINFLWSRFLMVPKQSQHSCVMEKYPHEKMHQEMDSLCGVFVICSFISALLLPHVIGELDQSLATVWGLKLISSFSFFSFMWLHMLYYTIG